MCRHYVRHWMHGGSCPQDAYSVAWIYNLVPSMTDTHTHTHTHTKVELVEQICNWLQSVSQFSRSVVSKSLRSHESQHARPPCPSPTLRVYSNSCPSSWWFHPAISSSVVPVSSCPQSLPASRSFPMSQLFAWCGQSISASASVLPMNTQDWAPLGWTG